MTCHYSSPPQSICNKQKQNIIYKCNAFATNKNPHRQKERRVFLMLQKNKVFGARETYRFLCVAKTIEKNIRMPNPIVASDRVFATNKKVNKPLLNI
jgi:glutathionyl-hydroquinone reductase